MENSKVKISKILKDLGVSPDLVGYRYLREAIQMVMEDDTLLYMRVTKELYPTIAKKFETTASRVERGMRHAIETSALRVDLELSQDIFGNTLSPSSGKLTNSQFIACIADHLTLESE